MFSLLQQLKGKTWEWFVSEYTSTEFVLGSVPKSEKIGGSKS
jgi:hypothetical protein